jgi:bacterial/archaeal transporter family-2 protein
MYFGLAALAGALLACMVFLNGALAGHVGPVPASFLVHGIGLVAASALWWAYAGGAFGGVLVIIVGVTVNSELGVSGTIAMLLLGQILTGWATDHFGWFGLPRRSLGMRDLIQVLLVMVGSGVLLHG